MNLCHQGRPCGDIRETCLEMMRLLGNTPCWRLVGTTGMASPVTKILLLGPIKVSSLPIGSPAGRPRRWSNEIQIEKQRDDSPSNIIIFDF